MEIQSDELYECPYCGSGWISADDIDPETWLRDVFCRNCKRTYQEHAKVYMIIIPEEWESDYLTKHPVQERETK